MVDNKKDSLNHASWQPNETKELKLNSIITGVSQYGPWEGWRCLLNGEEKLIFLSKGMLNKLREQNVGIGDTFKITKNLKEGKAGNYFPDWTVEVLIRTNGRL